MCTASVLVTQPCPTLCDPVDCHLAGPSVHGVLHAVTLEWAAISSSRGPPDPGVEPWSPVQQAGSFPTEPQGMLLPAEFQIQPEVFSLHVVLRKCLI